MAAARTPMGPFWIRWTVASGVGLALGVLAWVSLGGAVEALASRPGGEIPGVQAWLPVITGATFGAVLGAAQSLVLRGRLARSARWVLASAVGYSAVFLLGSSLAFTGGIVRLPDWVQILAGVLFGVAIALPVAFLQWALVLRAQAPSAERWIAVSCAAWGLGFGLSFALRLAMGDLSFVGGPAVAVALSGLGLGRLLREP